MRRNRLKTLRTVVFFLLAAILAVLAVIEAIPVKNSGVYSIATPFTVTAKLDEDGQYINTITGSVCNNSSTKKSPRGLAVRLGSQNGETYLAEVPAGTIDPGKVLAITAGVKTKQPFSKVLGVSTLVIEGDQPITVDSNGFQFGTGFIAFSVLSLGSLSLAIVFLIIRLRHRHYQKSEDSAKS